MRRPAPQGCGKPRNREALEIPTKLNTIPVGGPPLGTGAISLFNEIAPLGVI
jgi:hypothetical protein